MLFSSFHSRTSMLCRGLWGGRSTVVRCHPKSDYIYTLEPLFRHWDLVSARTRRLWVCKNLILSGCSVRENQCAHWNQNCIFLWLQVAGWFDCARVICVLTFHYQSQLLCLLKTSVCYQLIFMVDFRCPECNICFVASHQRDGHRRSVHQSTCKIRTATGRIIVNRSIDSKYPCPMEGYTSTFERSDTLQRHFKGRHAEQSNSALNQHFNNDAQIRAMS
jgi:hypothetical protein